MKVSVSFNDPSRDVPEQIGRDITTPGIYRSRRFGIFFYLVVVDSMTKLYVSRDGTVIQAASGVLDELVVPVKEKITITFDTTKD